MFGSPKTSDIYLCTQKGSLRVEGKRPVPSLVQKHRLTHLPMRRRLEINSLKAYLDSNDSSPVYLSPDKITKVNSSNSLAPTKPPNREGNT